MADRKPLVLASGEQQQLQSSDRLVDGNGDPIGGGALIASDVVKSANFSTVVGDKGKLYNVTTGSSTITATQPAAATAGDGWYIFLRKADSGIGTIAASPAESPSGVLAALDQGDVALLWSDGTTYFAVIMPASISGAGTIGMTAFANEVLARLNFAILT